MRFGSEVRGVMGAGIGLDSVSSPHKPRAVLTVSFPLSL